jgi:hypothetical protein
MHIGVCSQNHTSNRENSHTTEVCRNDVVDDILGHELDGYEDEQQRDAAKHWVPHGILQDAVTTRQCMQQRKLNNRSMAR